jgi:hypothetical protein
MKNMTEHDTRYRSDADSLLWRTCHAACVSDIMLQALLCLWPDKERFTMDTLPKLKILQKHVCEIQNVIDEWEKLGSIAGSKDGWV